MKITNVVLNMSKESGLSFYELKLKHEERSAIAMVMLITFAIFILFPCIIARMIFEMTDPMDSSVGLLEIAAVQSIIIVVLGICTTTNVYRCGKLFRLLHKNQDLKEALEYLHQLGNTDSRFEIAYILMFHHYQYSYLTEEDQLVVVYKDGDNEKYYTTYAFEKLWEKGCKNATLSVSEQGVQIIGKAETT